jgi:asparagine synthase (glutamine-hydrolysing)
MVDFRRPPEVELVERMASKLAHRGPDGPGSFAAGPAALGFRRLAIIDLSDAAMQPFASNEGRLQLLHNGEIYNYRELRTELEALGHRFRSSGDAEVVLAAYRQWGARCVERFNGMWALAIWDVEHERLFCSRDRFGVKPFYYRHADGRFEFASELKAFAVDPSRPLRPNPAAVREYLEQAYLDHTDATFFAGITRLPPAHSLVYDRDGLKLLRYWRLENREPPDDAEAAVRDLFLDSIRLRLRSDVPVGTALSGGMDSSAVAVAVDHVQRTETENARAVGARQRTFTAFFDEPGLDERPFAQAVVSRAEADARWISFGADDLVQDLPAIVFAQDEPFGSTSIAAGWYVMREAARAGVKVMLDGQGGDEVLAGYRAHLGFHLADLLAQGRLATLRTELSSFRDVHGPTALAVALARPFAPERLTRLVRARSRGSTSLLHDDLRVNFTVGRDGLHSSFPTRLRRYQELLLTRRGLPELLRYEDRNSMAHSIEARLPFLDYRLVELLFSLPAERLIERGTTKAVLRHALRDLLPVEVAERRDKIGFATPERTWFRGPLGAFAADVFASQRFRERGFVDARAASSRLERHRRGEIAAGMELWRALNVELWAQTFLDA